MKNKFILLVCFFAFERFGNTYNWWDFEFIHLAGTPIRYSQVHFIADQF